MRWTAALAMLAACYGSISGVDDDAQSSPPTGLRPLSCAVRATPPALPKLCHDGWCLDAPAPVDHVFAVLTLDGVLWLSLAGNVVRIDGEQTEWLPQPPGAPITRFVGSTTAGVWGFTATELFHLESYNWQKVTTAIDDIAVTHTGAVWARGGGRLYRLTAAGWQLTGVFDGRLTAIAADGDDDVWLGEDIGEQTYLVHRRGDELKRTKLDGPVRALWAAGPDDVWHANYSTLYHCKGDKVTRFALAGVEQLVGNSPDDLWAVAIAQTRDVSHWDGATWSSCRNANIDRLAAGPDDEVWAMGDHDLIHYDGAWSRSGRIEPVVDLEVVTPYDQLAATTAALLERAGDGEWHSVSIGGLVDGLASRGYDDVWAFGDGAYHRSGSTWIDTHDDRFYDLCVPPSHEAIASAAQGLLRFDGTTWHNEGATLGSDSKVFCLDDGQVWAGGAASIAERVGTSWRRTIGYERLFRAVAPPGGFMWSLGNDLGWFDGNEWIVAPTTGLDSILDASTPPGYYDVAGSGPRDVSLIVEVGSSRYIAHHDGTTFDRVTPARDVVRVFSIGVDDVIAVRSDFTTQRIRGGATSTLFAGPTSETLTLYFGTVWFASARAGWALSDDHHILRWNGRTWTRDATYPAAATALVAFSMNDVWTLTSDHSIAHWDGRRWSVTALPPLGFEDDFVDLWGASSAELWIPTWRGRVFRVVAGNVVELALTDVPAGLYAVHGRAANDIWFDGRTPTDEDALYHWDGSRFMRYRTLHAPSAMRTLDGSLFAKSREGLWQRTGGRWIPRPDLQSASVFPEPPPLPPNATQAFGDPASWWATGPNAIWRHQ